MNTEYNPFAPDGNETPDELVLGKLADAAIAGIAIADAREAAAEDVVYGRAAPLPRVDEAKAAKIAEDLALIDAAFSIPRSR